MRKKERVITRCVGANVERNGYPRVGKNKSFALMKRASKTDRLIARNNANTQLTSNLLESKKKDRKPNG
jgi:hypothetical protein